MILNDIDSRLAQLANNAYTVRFRFSKYPFSSAHHDAQAVDQAYIELRESPNQDLHDLLYSFPNKAHNREPIGADPQWISEFASRQKDISKQWANLSFSDITPQAHQRYTDQLVERVHAYMNLQLRVDEPLLQEGLDLSLHALWNLKGYEHQPEQQEYHIAI